MKKIERYKQMTISRVSSGILRRVKDFPHALAWKFNLGIAAENKKQLAWYKDKHKNERCFIIGNGPSLKGMDLDLLQTEYCFGLNRIYLLFETMAFRPTYFVSINDLVLSQFFREIASLKMPKFINWNMRNKFPSEDASINYVKLNLNLQDSFSKDITNPISSGGTVTFVALQLAYWMGFEEIILIGVDHSFSTEGVPNKTVMGDENMDKNHFHPDYFPKGVKWQLPDLIRSEIAYSLAKRAFEGDHRKIWDATVGGKLSVFPKVDFNDVL